MHRLDQVIQATHVEECLLLAGERRVGKILGRGRRTHGDGNVLTRGEFLPCGFDVLVQAFRKGSLHDPLPQSLSGVLQGIDIVDIQVIEHRGDTSIELICRQESAVSLGRGCEPPGYGNPEVAQV